MSSFTWTIMLSCLFRWGVQKAPQECFSSTVNLRWLHRNERYQRLVCQGLFIHRLQRMQVLIRNVNIFLFSTGIIAPVLSACCFSFQAASSVMIFYHRVCHAVCVCDTLSSWCSLTVFPVEQNKPLPQGFLVSKYRPQRIILKDCRVPKVVLQFTHVSL